MFHGETLGLLSSSYAPDYTAMRELAERSSALGVTLPASFVEWFGMERGIELLRDGGNADDPIAIQRLGLPIQYAWPDGTDWVSAGVLPFMIENQGVCVWGIRLDADDPEVVVAVDPEFRFQLCAERFSTFIRCRMWDSAEIYGNIARSRGRVLLQAQASPLSDADLQHLQRSFDERDRTYNWPTPNVYRFEGDEARVLVWAGEDQADWYVTATTEEGLSSAARHLWQCADLSGSLWSNDTRGEESLRRLRGKSRA